MFFIVVKTLFVIKLNLFSQKQMMVVVIKSEWCIFMAVKCGEGIVESMYSNCYTGHLVTVTSIRNLLSQSCFHQQKNNMNYEEIF